MELQPPVAVYVHTPFCPSKCGYCDFNSFAMTGEIVERTVSAIVTEIKRSPWAGRPAKTVFFGGGTPTFLESDQLIRILDAALEVHPLVKNSEVTSEANPGTVDVPKFGAMRKAGFNRISLGAQSFDPGDLMRLGRVHQAEEVGRAVRAAREAGFENVNLDLMFALPGQSPEAWQRNLDLALLLKPDHLSLYCLTIEPNTRFHRLHRRGMLHLPDEDAQVAMYDQAVSTMACAGLELYEISNFAKPGFECAHNLCYWRAEEYAAYGPGAVGCVDSPHGERVRYTNMKHPERYSVAVETQGELWCESETVDAEAKRLERLMLGIRLREGVEPDGVDPKALDHLVKRGWISLQEDRILLTPQGRHYCSEVTLELWPG